MIGELYMMNTITHALTEDEKNIVLLPRKGHEDQTITDYATLLQKRRRDQCDYHC